MNPFLTAGRRVDAPTLHAGGGWLGMPLDIGRDLRGRIILLWFFSASSIESTVAAEELRGLRRRFADVLTVLGVHVPYFPRERAPAAVRDAVGRLRLGHPVLDDHELVNWNTFALRLTPSLVLLDTHGRIAGDAEGSGHARALAHAVATLAEEGERDGTLVRDAEASDGLLDGDLDNSPLAGDGELAFPSGAAAWVTGDTVRLLAIADTGHDRLLVCGPDGQLLRAFAGFYQPHGLAFETDGTLLVCETGRHAVWRVDTFDGRRTLVTDQIAAPTDVVTWRGMVVVAGALDNVLVGVVPGGDTELLAGDGTEALRDGAAPFGVGLAQPRGLAVTADDRLAFVDAATSALRILDVPGGRVSTLVGHPANASGAQDGDRAAARLQYPLGLAADGHTLHVADAYNGRLRSWRDGQLDTVPLATFAEPAALAALPNNRLLVADRARHCAAIVDLGAGVVENWDVGRVGTDTPSALTVPTAMLADGDLLELVLDLDLDGDEIDDRSAVAPIAIRVTAAAEWLLAEKREWTTHQLPAEVEIPVRHGAGRVVVELRVACGDGAALRERRAAQPVDVIVT